MDVRHIPNIDQKGYQLLSSLPDISLLLSRTGNSAVGQDMQFTCKMEHHPDRNKEPVCDREEPHGPGFSDNESHHVI